MTRNIFIAGVGGQGIITASKVLSSALFRAGYDVKKSEIHGLSQRGGSVTSQIRFGEKVFSPVIPKGKVDYFISLELLETLRYLDRCSEKTRFIVNDFALTPISVSAGKFSYPENVEHIVRENGFRDSVFEDAYKYASENHGNIKYANSYLLGIFSKSIDIDIMKWHKAFEDNIRERHIKENIEAFEKGRNL